MGIDVLLKPLTLSSSTAPFISRWYLSAALGLALTGLVACSTAPEQATKKASAKMERSVDARLDACVSMLRQVRFLCKDGLREFRGRGGSARTNYDCLAAQLEFRKSCN